MSQQNKLLLRDDGSIICQGVTVTNRASLDQRGSRFLKSTLDILSNSGMNHLARKTPSTSPPPLHWNHHNPDVQASMIPFVLPVYPEPEGFGSLFTTHATHPPHSLRRRLVSTVRAWLITSEVGHTKISWREHKATLHLTFMLLGCFFFADRSLLTRGGGLGRGFGYMVCPEVETQADVWRHGCQLYLGFLCQPVYVEVSVAMQTC